MNKQIIPYLLLTIVVIMLLELFFYMYIHIDKMTNSPCEYCADSIGDNVVCSCVSNGRLLAFGNSPEGYFAP